MLASSPSHHVGYRSPLEVQAAPCVLLTIETGLVVGMEHGRLRLGGDLPPCLLSRWQTGCHLPCGVAPEPLWGGVKQIPHALVHCWLLAQLPV